MEATPGETAVVIHPELPLEEIISVDPLDPQAESVDSWISGVLFPEDLDELPDYNGSAKRPKRTDNRQIDKTRQS
jgi:hypothetical protein